MEESSIAHSAPHTTALWPLSSLLTQPWPPSAWGPCSGTALALLLPLLPLLGLDLSWLPRRLLSLQEPDATTKRWGVTPVSPSPRVESTYQRAISKKARTCTSSPTGVQNQGQKDRHKRCPPYVVLGKRGLWDSVISMSHFANWFCSL